MGITSQKAYPERLFSQVLYLVPGIWLGPVRIHLPSGNVLLQLPAPLCCYGPNCGRIFDRIVTVEI